MNNQDPSKNKKDQSSSSAGWAEFLDRLGQNAKPKSSDVGTESEARSKPVELTLQQLDDLELDRQLRTLGRISDPEDSFVDQVFAQTQSESESAAKQRPRLPVVGPTLISRRPEVVTNSSESPAEISEPIANTSEAVHETISVAPTDDRIDSNSALNVALPRAKFTRGRPVALLALLATILFVGCFFGSIWWFGAGANIADSSATDRSDRDYVRFNGISSQPNDARHDALEVSPELADDSKRAAADEALADQPMDRGIGSDSMAAAGAVSDPENRNPTPERFGGDISNKNPFEAAQKLDPADNAKNDGMAVIADEGNLQDQSIGEYISGGPSWDLKFDWNLAFQFQNSGVGLATLNGNQVEAIFLKDNASFLLRKVADELRRRVRHLENRLGSKITGSISVEDTTYRFDSASQLAGVVDKVEQRIGELDVNLPNLSDWMEVRARYRQKAFARRDRELGAINLAKANLKLVTEDEVLTIASVLSASEQILRKLARERLKWEKEFEAPLIKSKLPHCIKPAAFTHFANGGFLLPPDSVSTGQSTVGIQHFDSADLKRMLEDAPSIELFRDASEFQQAKESVYENGPAEMRLRLDIDNIDQTLNSKAILVTEKARAILQERKTRLAGELTKAINQSANSGDGELVEPLTTALANRTDLHGLPFFMGKTSRSDASEIKDLKQVSLHVGQTIGMFNGSLGSRDAIQNDALRNLTLKEMVAFCMGDDADNPSAQKLKTIDHILQIDHARLRLEAIKTLRKSGSRTAMKLLAGKAKYDLEPEVRIVATDALAVWDADVVRGLLLEGLRYPWHVVAEHSAEALVRLDDQDAVPQLIEMLDLPHPHYPFEDNGRVVQRELVGINHMRNCLLCHAPSMSSFDSVRGLIPDSNRPLPRHYYDTAGMAAEVPYAVRADVTYLQQDFSVLQSVKNPGPWPSEQRIDYVVQKKNLTRAEAKMVAQQVSQKPNRNWNAIVFALQQLTGETPKDNSSANWRMITNRDQGEN